MTEVDSKLASRPHTRYLPSVATIDTERAVAHLRRQTQ